MCIGCLCNCYECLVGCVFFGYVVCDCCGMDLVFLVDGVCECGVLFCGGECCGVCEVVVVGYDYVV